jgi:hypothetical protein
VLGLCAYALIGGLAAADPAAVRAAYTRHQMRVTAWFLIVIAVAFAALWLSDILPALFGGTVPATVTDLGVPTNAVHVLDLAFFLPAVMAVGVLLLRQRPLGYLCAPALLLFLALTGLPVLVTPFIADARGHETTWAILGPIGLITAAGFFALIRMLRAVSGARARTEAHHGSG